MLRKGDGSIDALKAVKLLLESPRITERFRLALRASCGHFLSLKGAKERKTLKDKTKCYFRMVTSNKSKKCAVKFISNLPWYVKIYLQPNDVKGIR